MINFSGNENISKLIDLEKISLLSTLDIQKNLNKQILIFVKNFMANTKISFDITPNDDTFYYLNESTNKLNTSNSNINLLKELLNSLEQLALSKNLEEDIKNYNNKFKESMNSVYSNTETIEKFIHKITVTDFSDLSSNLALSDETLEEQIPKCTTNTNLDEGFVEKTLIISDSQKKVILPYDINTVKQILLKNDKIYNSIEDVINKLYTRPISYYKFSPIARFKEAYKLVKEKEKSSIFKALSLAFELLGNYSLHPAIITACNSLDELDIYLACLEDNTLDDFHFFDIKYEIPLALSKLTSVSTLGISRLAKGNN